MCVCVCDKPLFCAVFTLYQLIMKACVKTLLFCSYDRARFEVDATFGQRFHPQFPRRLQSCDLSGGGCGSFPSTAGGRYRSGIDLNLDPNSQVMYNYACL